MDNAIAGGDVSLLHHGLLHGDKIAGACQSNRCAFQGLDIAGFHVFGCHARRHDVIAQHGLEQGLVCLECIQGLCWNRLEGRIRRCKNGVGTCSLERFRHAGFCHQGVERLQRGSLGNRFGQGLGCGGAGGAGAQGGHCHQGECRLKCIAAKHGILLKVDSRRMSVAADYAAVVTKM